MFGYELRATAVPYRNRKFKIQNSIFKISRGMDSTQGKPAAERTGLRPEGAALRPGAAAGCRSLRDRFCLQALSPKPEAAASGRIATEFSTVERRLQLAKRLHERTPKRTRAAGLRRAKLRPAAVPYRNRKFMIQNSIFKIKRTCRAHLSLLPVRVAACGAHARL